MEEMNVKYVLKQKVSVGDRGVTWVALDECLGSPEQLLKHAKRVFEYNPNAEFILHKIQTTQIDLRLETEKIYLDDCCCGESDDSWRLCPMHTGGIR